MSADYGFWKYKSKAAAHDDRRVYTLLSNGDTVVGLQELPVEEIRGRIRAVFSDWEWLDGDNCESPTGKGSFGLSTTPQFVRFDCYGMTEADINRLLDVLTQEFGCPLYDPQIGERFDSWADV